MEKVLVNNAQGESGIVNVVRYFLNNNKELLIYSLNEVDESGYTRLYVTKLNGTDGAYTGETLDDNEWNEVKNLVKVIVKANKEGMPVPIQDLDPKKITNITLKDKKVFKLNNPLVNDLSNNKNYGGNSQNTSTPMQPSPSPYEMPQTSAPSFEAPNTNPYEMPQASAPSFEAPNTNPYGIPQTSTPSYEMPQTSAPSFETPNTNPYEMPQTSTPSFEMPNTTPYEMPQTSAPSFEMPNTTPYEMTQTSTPSFEMPNNSGVINSQSNNEQSNEYKTKIDDIQTKNAQLQEEINKLNEELNKYKNIVSNIKNVID